MDISVKLPGLQMKNPIMPASGCFAFGEPFAELYDLGILGALVMKSTTVTERKGHPNPTHTPVDAGALNAVGLKNPGIDQVIAAKIPFLREFDTNIIASIAGDSLEEYVDLAKRLSETPGVKALEVNVSCPNVKAGGMSFGADPEMTYRITKAVKSVSKVPIYVKLSPNVSDIVSIAKRAEDGGADGLSLINTLIGMKIDNVTGEKTISNTTGGLSGRAVKPIAIRMIYQVYKHVSIPIIGMGGIETVDDIFEFLYAGASAVAVGTINYVNPMICKELIEALPEALKKRGFKSISDAVGFAHQVIK